MKNIPVGRPVFGFMHIKKTSMEGTRLIVSHSAKPLRGERTFLIDLHPANPHPEPDSRVSGNFPCELSCLQVVAT